MMVSKEPRIIIDAVDEKQISIKLLKNYETYDYEHVRKFPQARYNGYAGATFVPLTDNNLEHIFKTWKEEDYTLLPSAKLLIQYHLKTREVADIKAQQRLNYLKDKLVPPIKNYYYATTPFEHQAIAFESGRNAEFFALLMEMGTGKTKVVIDIICDRVLRGKFINRPARILVVCPKSIMHNWVRELAKHIIIDVEVETLRGTQIDKITKLIKLLRHLQARALIAIANYESLDSLKDALQKFSFDMMILDESIWIKTPGASRTKASIEIGRTCYSRFILTGLPITKSPIDLYSQFDFLNPGILGFTSHSAFIKHYALKDEQGQIESFKRNRLPELQKKMNQFSFIIKSKQCLDLPEKIYKSVEITMGKEQAAAYEKMLTEFIIELENDSGEKGFTTANIILVQLLRLSQITSGHVKLTDGSFKTFNPNPKIEAIREYIEGVDIDNDKIIVWSRFREDVKLVVDSFPELKPVAYYGGINDKQKIINLDIFDTDKSCRLMSANQQSGGFGLNLVVANHSIYLCNDYSLGNRQQSEKRINRIGQTKHCIFTDLVVPESIDQIVLDAIQTKMNFARMLTDKEYVVSALRDQLLLREKVA